MPHVRPISSPDNPHRSPLMQWINQHREHRGQECLFWPFVRNSAGYATYGREGKIYYVHRYMCEFTHGPGEGLQAAHSCGNGDKGCVNPQHVSWKSPSDNQKDRDTHGTSMRNYGRWKLTAAQVIEIRAADETPSHLARKYGVSEANIRQIKSGKTWGPNSLSWKRATQRLHPSAV